MPLPRLESADVKNKRVLVTADFKSQDGRSADSLKVDAVVPTLELLLNRGASVLLGTHLGLQLNDESVRTFLEQIAERLQSPLGAPPNILLDPFTAENQERLRTPPPGSLTLLENLQNFPEETGGNEDFAKMLASMVDLYVNDSLQTCMTPYATATKLPDLVPGYAGLTLFREVETFRKLFTAFPKPFTLIVGGVDLERKIKFIRKLLPTLNTVLIGGGISYTFLKSRAKPIGNSFFESDFQVDAFQTLERAELAETEYQLPVDHIIADQFSRQAKTKKAGDIPDNWQGMDIGPKTISSFEKVIKKSGTVIWYGPMGVTEFDKFAKGSESIAHALKKAKARTVVLGESCLKIVDRLKVTDQIDHVCLGSRAACEILMGAPLPGLVALEQEETES